MKENLKKLKKRLGQVPWDGEVDASVQLSETGVPAAAPAARPMLPRPGVVRAVNSSSKQLEEVVVEDLGCDMWTGAEKTGRDEEKTGRDEEEAVSVVCHALKTEARGGDCQTRSRRRKTEGAQGELGERARRDRGS